MTSIRIIQLSDSHLFGDASGCMSGVDTRATFRQILASVREKLTSDSIILVTGDLTQDESPESYQWLKQQLEDLKTPFYWLAGNHDRPELMAEACPTATQKQVFTGEWQLLLLDSHTSGIPGTLSDEELEYMEQQLAGHRDRHTLIAFHHPAYTIDSLWLDEINLLNHKAFWNIVERYPNVRVVINGHIHQEVDYKHQQVRVLAAPSTAIQFKPHSEQFALDSRTPGYRILDLHKQGRLTTQIVRLASE